MEDYQVIIFAVFWAVIWYFIGQFRGLMWATKHARDTVNKAWDARHEHDREEAK